MANGSKRSDHRMTASEQVREAITKSGLSLREIARRTGVTQAALSLFMNRKRSLTLDTVDKLQIWVPFNFR